MLESLVSIILPVYNRKKYLAQAIDSVLQQTYQNWELIVADDHSHEDTKSFLQRYAAITKIHIYSNPHNIGLFANLNKAIRRCNGEYITILCSDDFLSEQCLEVNLNLMRKYVEANLILSSTYSVNADGNLLHNVKNFYDDYIAKQTRLLQPEQSVPLLLQYGSINGNITGMFFRKTLYEQVGDFREDWRHAADWEWIYRVASSSPILISRANVAVIRIHEEQLSVVNGKNLSASLEVSQMVKMLLADPRLRTLESARRWALHIMQFHLWFALKLAFKGYWSESLTIARAVEKATGFSSTFWTMLRLLPHRWQVYRQKSFFLPPD
ncbi:glycosyltransferase [Aetokthonos hydrillicola Thurmond2011]|jgi:glycosyltransferase involved in cell wall biosynthesis|uniref:Glycosyltransferase n=1 Tax=Aetokthonos hydrillicola Thurmond2011 TaxID=2712845 RepID=A0AAP5ICZ3_9CYAN|nr:glycosyltransferase [Aetokthonos hydrillicola]MBO3460283.1 glycosyltransferase [Aetokthonos hydrillicola CCALA 1050]MBW4587619.1 glycosyltransferase [Aetokthonos hydrillicola CCALA 1050]MDR9897999.1 glycosyltransferase [Aetokthonos hydrillicola Thurmond2011]